MKNNEVFIFHNTRTSHKRLESMVVYALHYALRNVEILSQYHVATENGSFKIDAYLPAIKLAVEIDEPYHERQHEKDARRQEVLEKKLGCCFYRINCKESIYRQIDKLVELVEEETKKRCLDPWVYEPKRRGINDGEYSKGQRERLEEAGIPDMMDALADELKREGNEIFEGSIRGIPSQSNGEYGFLLKNSGFTFALYARASGSIAVRVMDYEDEDDGIDWVGVLGLERRQENPAFPKGCKYFALPDRVERYRDQRAAKEAFYEFVSLIHDVKHCKV